MSLRNYLNGAHLVDFHDLHMKSDEVMDLLERFGIDVIYDFDRLREGTPDHTPLRRLTKDFNFGLTSARL